MTSVEFGRSFTGPRHEQLRKEFWEVSPAWFPARVHVDDVLANAFSFGSEYQDTVELFVFLDVNRVFIYRRSDEAEAPSVADLLRNILDDRPFHLENTQHAYADDDFPFPHDVRAIASALAYYWSFVRPGGVLILDCLTGEIRSAVLHPHPMVAAPIAVNKTLSGVSGNAQFPGVPMLEADVTLDLSGLVSPDLGPIRSEKLVSTDASIPGAVTRVSYHGGRDDQICGAKALRPSRATYISRCEALERFQILSGGSGEDLTYGCFEELGSRAVDPADLFFCNGSAADTHSLALRKMYWACGRSVTSGEAKLIPAQEIWFNTATLPGENVLIQNTTNGCAVGADFGHAAVRALLEIIERDAYLTMWYLRRTPLQIDPSSVALIEFQTFWARMSYTFPDYAFYCFDIRTETRIPAVTVIAVRRQGTGPKTVHAAAAAVRVENALFAALKDLSIGLKRDPVPGQRLTNLIRDENAVTEMDDHVDLFSADEAFGRLDFLSFDCTRRLKASDVDPFVAPTERAAREPMLVVEKAASRLQQHGVTVYLKDLTYDWIGKRGLFCVRAIAPGLYPMWYGTAHRRFRLTQRLRKLAVMFGKPEPSDDSVLNLGPHPFD